MSEMTEDFADLVDRWSALKAQHEDVPHDVGVAWLKDALSAAIKLEFSTIPPYLCALWSIKDQSTPVALSIRGIVQEEMLHMALACNMLVAIGGTPPIGEPGFAPVYPGKLAGGVHPHLTVALSGLNRNVLEAFMIIELPEKPVQAESDELSSAFDYQDPHDAHETIGRFYSMLEEAFATLSPALCPDRQISGPLSWFPVRNVDEVKNAIELIKHQGEGSPQTPMENEDGKPVLAHYYRFLEIYAGRKIVRDKTRDIWTFGPEIAPVDVYPMAEVPSGGYDTASLPEEAAALIDAFDAQYTRLLSQLDHIWRDGDQGALVHAIETMFSLQGPARALMNMPISDDPSKTYGPCFRYTGDQGRDS